MTMTSAAVRQYCTFTLDGHHFGIDVASVQEVIRYQALTVVPLAPHAIRGLINLRGQIVTALDLRLRLGMPERDTSTQPVNIVIRTDDGAVSFLVDEIGDIVEADQTCFESPPDTLREGAKVLILGACKLHDRLLLVLDAARAASIDDSGGDLDSA